MNNIIKFIIGLIIGGVLYYLFNSILIIIACIILYVILESKYQQLDNQNKI